MANHYSTRVKKLSDISIIADRGNDCGSIDKEQHKELKKIIRKAQLDNLFAAMAGYCLK